jgi:hypothetical protein
LTALFQDGSFIGKDQNLKLVDPSSLFDVFVVMALEQHQFQTKSLTFILNFIVSNIDASTSTIRNGCYSAIANLWVLKLQTKFDGLRITIKFSHLVNMMITLKVALLQ